MDKPEKKEINDLPIENHCKGCCSGECQFCRTGYNIAIEKNEAFLEYLKQIVIEDVPHQYQDRLLKELCNHDGEFKNGVCLECGKE